MKNIDVLPTVIFILWICVLLTFIGLKLFGIIVWSWLWVFSPLWIAGIGIILVLAWIGIQFLKSSGKIFNP